MTLLTGRALDWASAVWDSDLRIKHSLDYFIELLREVFEYPAGGRNISTQIINIKQGHRTAAEFAIKFRTLAAQSGWNDVSLKAMFYNSLHPDLQTELACGRDDSSFSEFVSVAIKIDNLMRQAPRRRNDKGNSRHLPAPTSTATTSSEEPMQLSSSRLSAEERERRRSQNLCYYCGESGHRSAGCPQKTQTKPRVNINHFFQLNNRTLTLPVTLKNDTLSLTLTVMVDSGAALNIIHQDIVEKYQIPVQPCTPPIRIKAIDNALIGEGISHSTRTLTLQVGLMHQESITLYVVNSPKHEVILGFPWLSTHDPDISWRSV
ncbi:retrotransposon-derived PEG10 isoform 1 [Labeo rohita]|uniref:Retrotransposon-derived PEG10 isoform 1 n=1 Tax=Labeo rohita TaxID=84645 RepID=A0A498LWZ8_LABRO|nr:retrotransposon-derived PEG10 isoform 1 [Labeo rohita]